MTPSNPAPVGDEREAPWIKVADELPPEGVEVETKIDDEGGSRNEQSLKRKGSLWFFPDMSMYVYYSPTHWRQKR